MTTAEHLAAWGVPAEYCRDHRIDPHAPHAHLRGNVSAAANWYWEQDAALAAMVRAGDAAAIRAWDRDALVRAGRETSADPDDDGESYADGVMVALTELADAVEADAD